MLAPFEPGDAAALAGAILAGALVSLIVPVRRFVSFPASRYRIGRPDPAARVSLKPLSTDLSVAIAARLQPKTLARSVVPFLLVAPSGMAPLEAVMMGLGVAAGLYVHSLSSALKDCADGARRWSASLPLDPRTLPGYWRRAARIRVGVAGTLIAILMLSVVPLTLALPVLLSIVLWVEMQANRGLGS